MKYRNIWLNMNFKEIRTFMQIIWWTRSYWIENEIDIELILF